MSGEFLTQEAADKMRISILGLDEPESMESAVGPDGVRPYEMGRQERIVRGRMPTLEIINERFGRYLRVGLFSFMRKNPEITVGPVKVQKYSDFIRNLAVPANLNVVNLQPLRGNGLFIFDPALVDTVIEAMFGGRNQYKSKVEGRELTPTESKIVKEMLNVVFAEYTKAWAPVHAIQPEMLRSEMYTQFANIANPSEIVVSTSFSIEIGACGGMFHICFPYSMIEPIRDALYSSMQGDQAEPDRRWTGSLRTQIENTKVELVADLASTTLSLRDIASMQVGDFIEFDIPKFVEARVGGVAIMDCKYGVKNGRYSLKVNDVYQERIEQTLVAVR